MTEMYDPENATTIERPKPLFNTAPAIFDKPPFVSLAPACSPTKAYEGDAGYDAYARGSVIVRPGEVKKIPLGVVWNGPPGWFCMVQEKSGMAMQGLQSIGNVIDEGYTGEVCVILVNHGKKTWHFGEGDKVCQLVPMLRYVEAGEDSMPVRKGKGFGSSGLRRYGA